MPPVNDHHHYEAGQLFLPCEFTVAMTPLSMFDFG